MFSYSLDYLFVLSVLQIVWIDVVLSGDNAVVIAMACRGLPDKQRRLGIALGVGLAMVLRIVMAACISFLLNIPLLGIIGGCLLFYIAVKVVRGEEESEGTHKNAVGLLQAMFIIAVADASMSLDNVVAVAAAAHGNDLVFILGLAISVPFMMVGASFISSVIARWPWLVWAGGALLGWVGGAMIGWIGGRMLTENPWSGPFVERILPGNMDHALMEYGSAVMGAIGVVLVSSALIARTRRLRRRSAA